MIKMYSGCARNSKDVDRAVVLAAKTFRSNEKIDAAINVKKLLLSPEGGIAEQDVVVLSDDAGEILGTCFLIDRFFYRGRNKLKGTFLTSICIADSSRGKGYSALLMNCAIAEVERRGAAFAILIARRAVDHFYNKFNFWGLPQYSKILLKLVTPCTTVKNFTFTPATESDLAAVSTLHESTYSGLYGSCERSLEYWKHVLWRADSQSCNFFIYRIQGGISGYVLFSGSDIYEFASAQDASCFELINDLGQYASLKEATLHCSDKHPVLRELQGVDFSLTRRQCIYGGHMVRIINETALLKELAEEVKDAIGSLGMKDYKEIHGDALIELQNGIVEITLTGSPYGYRNTCLLMGAEFLTMGSDKVSVFKPHSFNVPLFDQC
jgi:predicted acetyltransferase